MLRLFFTLISIAAVVFVYYLLLDGYGGPLKTFVNNYALETTVVAAAYFLSVTHKKIRGNKIAKALIILVFAVVTEVSRLFDINMLGTEFDPLDFFFFIAGLAGALIIDYQIITRFEDRGKLRAE
ncbi:MAG: hypothetical protein LC102_08685 [Ignavibacteriales bacterium]|nr:MAG: hypothetical protein F9K26_04995 [Ignavibacteriaceae bacterium]MBW7872768.1 hypothetical protein [Ignavibacteria bacterium]MCZ2143488.1 hypothetical protein [Ignavibacteriales bacterium]MBV6444365.1 hypothetical protein [Ignavibacteriaceae bacterium]MBZ0197170.1 hypothetical protein [Ignavibacteriaceae bacterium]